MKIDFDLRAMGITKSGSSFENVDFVPTNVTLNLFKALAEDSSPSKVDLCIGAYRTEENQPYVLPVVRKTETKLAENPAVNHEYLPACGESTFTNAGVEYLLGKDSPAIEENRVLGFQSISGTGAIFLGAKFLVQVLTLKTVYLSNPTWENHHRILTAAGLNDIRTYRYYNSKTRSIDIDGMCDDLENTPKGSIVLLHASCHNPTGCDPTPVQWVRIAKTLQRKDVLVFFDSAYQGFASGDSACDAFAVRYFVSQGFELLCAQSFSKIFGLYSERVGNLVIVHKESAKIASVKDHLMDIACDMYLNPPGHGARIVQTILNDAKLYEEWQDDVKVISNRLISMRSCLHAELLRLKTPGTWNHIIDQVGMFSYTGLNEKQVKYLMDEYHIYLRKTGRISLCGLSQSNVVYVAKAIHSAITSHPN